MSDPKGGYFAWRTAVAKRASFPGIDWAFEQVLRECWGAAYDRGRKDGVLATADMRSAADAYRDFTALLERWEQEQMILALSNGHDAADGEEEAERHRRRM